MNDVQNKNKKTCNYCNILLLQFSGVSSTPFLVHFLVYLHFYLQLILHMIQFYHISLLYLKRNRCIETHDSLLLSWESKSTPLATLFFKRAYKIIHPPRLWVSWIDLPSFASSSKIWPNFSNKVFFCWSYKKVRTPNLLFFNKKKFRKIRMIFDIEISLWKSNFRTLRWAAKLGKVSKDA